MRFFNSTRLPLSRAARTAAVCLTLTFGLVATSQSPADADTKQASLASIMAALAAVKGADATFSETRESAFLTGGLKSSGQVLWRAPASLTKITLEPFEETVSVEGSEIKLTRTDDGRTRGSVISIEDYPELRSIVESVRSTLAGDATELKNNFSVSVTGSPDTWKIELKPMTKKLAKSIESILIAGTGTQISEFQTTEADGDVSVMTLSYQKIW